MSMTADKRLLVIDDEPGICDFVAAAAKGLGFEVLSRSDASSIREDYDNFQPGTIVLDVMMPDMDGIEVLRYLAGRECSASIFIMSGHNSTMLGRAERLGAGLGLNICGSLRKPFRLKDLRSALASA